MKAPKLLPWYARKAGVSVERAEALWRKMFVDDADPKWIEFNAEKSKEWPNAND